MNNWLNLSTSAKELSISEQVVSTQNGTNYLDLFSGASNLIQAIFLRFAEYVLCRNVDTDYLCKF